MNCLKFNFGPSLLPHIGLAGLKVNLIPNADENIILITVPCCDEYCFCFLLHELSSGPEALLLHVLLEIFDNPSLITENILLLTFFELIS